MSTNMTLDLYRSPLHRVVPMAIEWNSDSRLPNFKDAGTPLLGRQVQMVYFAAQMRARRCQAARDNLPWPGALSLFADDGSAPIRISRQAYNESSIARAMPVAAWPKRP